MEEDMRVEDVYESLKANEESSLSKEKLIVPAGIRYISDWTGYRLEDFPKPHILDKVLTGCGYTEYCLRNDQNLILCSPRKMLLENKAEQHPEPRVYYAKNEADENALNYERGFKASDSKKAIKDFHKRVGTIEFGKEGPTAEEIEEKKKKVLEYKNKIKNHILLCKNFGMSCKILVTYDSFRHVKEVLVSLKMLSEFQVVVDEFQSILVDCKFKPDAELELLHHLKGIDRVCFVSATPMLDKYLKRLDEFKDLPYYQLDWIAEDPDRLIKPNLNVSRSNNISKDIIKVISAYKEGKFERISFRDEEGKINEVISKEAVIYVNSVKMICSMIVRNNLLPDQCNVLCARTPENEKKVKKAFNDVYKKLKLPIEIDKNTKIVGSVPLEGQPHKMFTFCTRTVYLGADFYSPCARSFIFCDSNIDCLSVDISMDLPQILGRQRLNENPWKNSADIYISSTTFDLTKADFDKKVNKKIEATLNLLGAYADAKEKYKHDLADTYESAATIDAYEKNYIAVNRHAGNDLIPVFNKLMLVSDERAFDIQQMDYADRVSIFNTLHKRGFHTNDVEAELKEFEELVQYMDKMKYVCELKDRVSDAKFSLFLDSIPVSFKNYYTILGPAKCKAVAYKKSEMEKEYQRQLNNQAIKLDTLIYDKFKVGDKLTSAFIKEELAKIYKITNYIATAKAIDLGYWFEMRPIKITDKDTKRRMPGFELLRKKEAGEL